MEVKWIYHNGIRVLALVVNDNDPYEFCENCGKKHYSHPKLAIKEDKDWCGDCNDEYFKKHMSDAELGMWTIYEMERNRAVVVVRELDVNE
jgi:hypothetical protein|tara:strand:- start:339 stop:611 length:273 start_codon:yes stop_codon:yes gene_type:complete